MSREYKTVAMPQFLNARPRRGRTRADAIADALSEAINREAADGWSYLRAEQFRTHERRNVFSRAEEVVYSVLVFERGGAPAQQPAAVAAPTARAPMETVPAPRRREPELAQPEVDAPPVRAPRRAPERRAEPEIDFDAATRGFRGGRREPPAESSPQAGDAPFGGRARRPARPALDTATDDAARAMRRPPSRPAVEDDDSLFDDRPVGGRRARAAAEEERSARGPMRRRPR